AGQELAEELCIGARRLGRHHRLLCTKNTREGPGTLQGNDSENDETQAVWFWHSSLGIRHSFVIRHSLSHSPVSPSSSWRRRRSTRHLATQAAPSLIPSSRATSAADRPSTTCIQHAFHVAGWNCACM